MAFTPVTVSGTFLITDDLTPARGEITFRLSQSMQDTAANQIVSADRRSVRLDATGSFSIVLPATDDTTTQPTGVTYEVEELIEDQAPRRYAIALPKANTNVNLADIAPAVPGPAMFQYALVGHTHAGGGGDLTYVHTQGVALAVWTVNHNLGKLPAPTVLNALGEVVLSEIHHVDTNTLTVHHAGAMSGSVTCN